jgi:hypothetical protein
MADEGSRFGERSEPRARSREASVASRANRRGGEAAVTDDGAAEQAVPATFTVHDEGNRVRDVRDTGVIHAILERMVAKGTAAQRGQNDYTVFEDVVLGDGDHAVGPCTLRFAPGTGIIVDGGAAAHIEGLCLEREDGDDLAPLVRVR